jgi:hypothetical protein
VVAKDLVDLAEHTGNVSVDEDDLWSLVSMQSSSLLLPGIYLHERCRARRRSANAAGPQEC